MDRMDGMDEMEIVGNGQPQMDSPKWTASNGQSQMETLSLGYVLLKLSIWDCPFEAVHLGLSISFPYSDSVHYQVPHRFRFLRQNKSKLPNATTEPPG
jgi:hypothetical protein